MRFLYRYIFFSFLLLFCATSRAQIDTIPQTGPIGGFDALINRYFDIEFTKEQRDMLKGKEIEFIYSVDSAGNATLDIINGIEDRGILDSFHNASQNLPAFYPVKNEYAWYKYFLKIQFPDYKNFNNLFYYNENRKFAKTKFADFEMIDVAGSGFEFVFGASGNTYLGKPQEYLQSGLGFMMETMFTTNNGIGIGIPIRYFDNKLKKEFPVDSEREQNERASSVFVGLSLNKKMGDREKSKLIVGVELGWSSHTLSYALHEEDRDWIQVQGFSPGIIAHYSLLIGKHDPTLYYARPALFSNYLNIHAAIRPMIMGLKEATGIMAEIGIGYRFRVADVRDYKLREE